MFSNRTNDDVLWQMSLRQCFVIERIIDYEIETRTQVRHITTKGVIRIDRNLQSLEVQTIVWCKEGLQVSVFITLYLPAGETSRLEMLKSLITNSIHQCGRMVENHLPTLLIQFYILLLATHYSSPISSLIQS